MMDLEQSRAKLIHSLKLWVEDIAIVVAPPAFSALKEVRISWTTHFRPIFLGTSHREMGRDMEVSKNRSTPSQMDGLSHGKSI